MISSASRVMSRFCPLMPSTLNIAQSLGRPDAATPKFSRPLGEVVEHRDAVGELGRMMIGQQEAAGADAEILGLPKTFDDQQVGRRMRLPGRGVVLADPGFLVAELVEPAQHLQVPVVTFLQPALRRMRGHREISEFHGLSSRFCFFDAHHLRATRSLARNGEVPRLGCGGTMTFFAGTIRRENPSRGARIRAFAPATICIEMPAAQPSQIRPVQAMCGSSRRMMMPTEKNAVSVARKVPTALKNSAASIAVRSSS